MTIVILHHDGKGVATSVGSVIVSAIVDRSPIHELKVAVEAVSVRVKEIHETEFSKTDFKPALWKLSKQRKRCAVSANLLPADRDDLMPLQPRYVRRFAQGRIPHHVQVRETSDTQGLANTVSSSFLQVEEEFRRVIEPSACEQRQHPRSGILCLRCQTVRPLVR